MKNVVFICFHNVHITIYETHRVKIGQVEDHDSARFSLFYWGAYGGRITRSGGCYEASRFFETFEMQTQRQIIGFECNG